MANVNVLLEMLDIINGLRRDNILDDDDANCIITEITVFLNSCVTIHFIILSIVIIMLSFAFIMAATIQASSLYPLKQT